MKANLTDHTVFQRLVLLGGYAVPWFTIYVILRIWIGYAPWIAGDTVAGMLGHGLSWVSGFPNFTNHVPMPFSTQLAAIIYGLSQPQENGLKHFHDVSLVVELIILLSVSLWFGYAAQRLQIPKRAGLVLGLISVSMPTMMLGATAFTGYVPFLICLPPAMLVFIFQVNRKKPFQIHYFVSLVLIGFCIANLFTLGLLAFLVPVLCVVLHKSDLFVRIKELHLSKKYFFLSYASLLAAFQSFVLGIMFYSDPVHAFGRETVQKLVSYGMPFVPDIITLLFFSSFSAVVLLVITGVILKKFQVIHKLYLVLIAPLLIGWLIASNIWAPFWMMSAIHSLKSKGGTGSGTTHDITEGLLAFFNLHFVHTWIWVICLSIGIILALWIASKVQKNEKMGNYSICLFVLCGLHFFLMLPLFLGMIKEIEDATYIGLATRYFSPFIGGLACSMAVFTMYQKNIGVAVGLFLAVSSVYIYGNQANDLAQKYSTHEMNLENTLSGFLKKSEQEKAVCLRTEIPTDCGLLYGYNNYRTINSKKRFPPITLRNGRLLYLNDCWKRSEQACISFFDQYFQESNKVLIIGLKNQIKTIENKTHANIICLQKAPTVNFNRINAYLCEKVM